MNLKTDTIVECLGACLETRKGPGAYQAKFKNKQHFDFGVIDGYIAESGKDRVIIFRGSDELKDWFTNLTFTKKIIPYEGVDSKIRVHSGFINEYKKVRKYIQDACYGYQKIIVVGQSLGAAIATLCAVDIQYNFDAEVICLPFGSPRVGNKYFRKSFDKRIPQCLRAVYGRDVIPTVPWYFLGFRHIGRLYEFGPKRPFIFWPSIRQHIISIQQVEALAKSFEKTKIIA